MANGNARCEQIEAAVAVIERRLADKSDARDREIGEIRAVLADLGARLGNLETTGETTATAIDALKSVRPPGFVALAGPAIAAAVMVGSLGAWALDMTTGPIREAVTEIKDGLRHYQADVTARVRMVEDRQDDVRSRLARLEGRTEAQSQRIDDVDKFGSRRWVGKDVK